MTKPTPAMLKTWLAAAISVDFGRVSKTALPVILAIYRRAVTVGADFIRPGVMALAEEAGVSASTAHNRLKDLESLGLIRESHKGSTWDLRAATWQLRYDNLGAPEPLSEAAIEILSHPDLWKKCWLGGTCLAITLEVAKRRKVTVKELVLLVGKSESTVRRSLGRLKQAGIVHSQIRGLFAINENWNKPQNLAPLTASRQAFAVAEVQARRVEKHERQRALARRNWQILNGYPSGKK